MEYSVEFVASAGWWLVTMWKRGRVHRIIRCESRIDADDLAQYMSKGLASTVVVRKFSKRQKTCWDLVGWYGACAFDLSDVMVYLLQTHNPILGV